MISVKPIEIADKAWIDKYTKQENSRSADYSFTNMFAWSGTYSPCVGEFGGRMIIKLCHSDPPIFSFPAGDGELGPVIEEMRKDSGENKLRIRAVTKENLQKLEALYPGQFTAREDRDYWDYAYLIEKMVTLTGKKLHAKRNHINRFLACTPNWSFEPISSTNMHECIEMNEEWVRRNSEERHESFKEEVSALEKVFSNYKTLGLEGALIRINGCVVAYTIGERLNSDTFVVHYEKAYSDINGAYTIINREFATHIHEKYPDIIYINREEDMGHENLRRAKMSYCPDMMIEKYTVVFNQ